MCSKSPPQPHPNATFTSTSPVVQHHLCEGPRFWMAWHCRAAGKDEVVAPEELVHRGNRRHRNVLLSTEGGLVTVRQWKTEQKRQGEWQRMQKVETRHVRVYYQKHTCARSFNRAMAILYSVTQSMEHNKHHTVYVKCMYVGLRSISRQLHKQGTPQQNELWRVPTETPSSMPLASLWVHCLEDPHESLHDPWPGTLDHSWAEVGQLVGSQQPCNTQRPGIIEVGAVPAESQKRVSLLC